MIEFSYSNDFDYLFLTELAALKNKIKNLEKFESIKISAYDPDQVTIAIKNLLIKNNILEFVNVPSGDGVCLTFPEYIAEFGELKSFDIVNIYKKQGL